MELPKDNPQATIATAAQIGNSLIASGLAADIQKKFPNISPQQLKGVYLTWNVGSFNGKKSVFFLTGIQYTGALPDAQAIADYCESRVKDAVTSRFPVPQKNSIRAANGSRINARERPQASRCYFLGNGFAL